MTPPITLRSFVWILMLSGAACGDAPNLTGPSPVTAPTSATIAGSSPARTRAASSSVGDELVVSDYVRIERTAGLPAGTTRCASAANGDRFYVFDISASNPSEHTYQFDGVAFHSPVAGCAPTLENPSTHGGRVGRARERRGC